MSENKKNYPKFLFGIFVLLWTVLAIHPKYRFDWFLENILTLVVIPLLILFYRKGFFSNLSWSLIFVFLLFHIVGAHYTYSEVPFAENFSRLLGAERNHYDRLVHLLCGLLLTRPLCEILSVKIRAGNGWVRFISFCVILASGAIYELMEWLTAMIVAPEAGAAFLGIQGDIWDAQKDLGLKLLGAALSLLFPYRIEKTE